MIVRGEPQPLLPGEGRALAAAAAEDPDLHLRTLPGDHMGLFALGGAVGAGQQGEDVADLLSVVLWLRTGRLQKRLLQCEARRAEQVLEGEPGWDAQPVGCLSVHDGRAAEQGRLALHLARMSAGAAQAKVKASGVEGVNEPELLHRRQRGAVPELDGAGADADRRRGRGRQRQHDRG